MNVQVRLKPRAVTRHDRRSVPERRQLSRPDEAQLRLRRAREAGPSQDEALYRCKCGFVFRAQVSTSVSCPHCESTQAW